MIALNQLIRRRIAEHYLYPPAIHPDPEPNRSHSQKERRTNQRDCQIIAPDYVGHNAGKHHCREYPARDRDQRELLLIR